MEPKTRGGVILIEDDRVALIKRVNDRGVYYLFPGGGVEDEETIEEAAIRESLEELGLKVRIVGLIAVVAFQDKEQYYYLAETIGGLFGTGAGTELSSPPDSVAGTYTPVWLPRSRLLDHNVRPPELARLLAAGVPKVPVNPLRLVESVSPQELS